MKNSDEMLDDLMLVYNDLLQNHVDLEKIIQNDKYNAAGLKYWKQMRALSNRIAELAYELDQIADVVMSDLNARQT